MNEEKIPDKGVNDGIFKCISEVAEEEGMLWYAFLKDVRRSYDIGENSTPIYIGEGKEKKNEFKKRFKPYIDGITNNGNQKQSYTFTLFAKTDENEIEEVKKEIETKLNEDNLNVCEIKREWVR